MKILLIDDSKMQHRIAQIYFKKSPDYVLVTADSGSEGIQCALREKPDVILLDLFMPEMSGEQVLKKLKSGRNTARIPVIMCSGYFDGETREMFTDLGADGFIDKPHGYSKLMNVIADIGGAV